MSTEKNRSKLTVERLREIIDKHQIGSIETSLGTVSVFPISYSANCKFWKEVEKENEISDESFIRLFIRHCCYYDDINKKEATLTSKQVASLTSQDIHEIVKVYLEYQRNEEFKGEEEVHKDACQYESDIEELRMKIIQEQKSVNQAISNTCSAFQEMEKSIFKLDKTIFAPSENIFKKYNLIERLTNPTGQRINTHIQRGITPKEISIFSKKISMAGILGLNTLEQCSSMGEMATKFQSISQQASITTKIASSNIAIMLDSPSHINHWNKLDRAIQRMRNSYWDFLSVPRTSSIETYKIESILEETSKEMLVSEYTFGKLINAPDIDDFENEVADATVSPDELESMLRAVTPGLIDARKGAIEAFNNKGTDYRRHVLTSQRELWSHLLRELAPDDDVSAWIDGLNHSIKTDTYYHDKKLTRKARLDFIYRRYKDSSLSSFIDKDISAILEMIRTFNHLHELNQNIEDWELKVLLSRSDSSLRYILNIGVD